MLLSLLQPKSIAVIGASDDTSKPGGRILWNLLSKGYSGELLVMHPRNPVIQGVRAQPTIQDLPLTPDLAFIVVPSAQVRPSLEALAAKGTKAVVVLSAGFGELGAEGKAEEQRLAAIATAHNMLLLGPNCLGVMSAIHAGKFAGILPDMMEGGIDFISGSGATVDYLAEQAVQRGLPFHSFLTVGNAAQTSVADLLALFDAQPGLDPSPIKILYLETIPEPVALLRVARSLSSKGCILAGIKSGTTQAGSRAAASHTGAMTTPDTAVQALFDKAGIIRVQSRQELIDVASVLVSARGHLDGRRVGILTDAGGPGVMLADELNRQGLDVPPLRARTQARLAEVLPAGAGLGNPIDCLPSRTGATIAKVFAILEEEEADSLDYLLFVMGDSGLADNGEIYQALLQAMDSSSIPILPSLCTAISSRAALDRFKGAGKCYFQDEVDMGRALGRVVHRPRLSEPVGELPGYDRARIASVLEGLSGALSPKATREVLEAAGLRYPRQWELHEPAQLAGVDSPFPWVMKVMGPLHKSDLGGVRIGIGSLLEAEAVWTELMRIPGANGCLVQQLITGTEVILGANREPGFGHLLAFGMGGIYTEVLRDVRFALAPLSQEEARGMIHSLRAFPVLQGVRGQPGMDLPLLQDWLVRVGRLCIDFPSIQELDLNPVKGQGAQLCIVDARILQTVN